MANMDDLTRWLDDEVYPRLSHEMVFGDLAGFRRGGPGRYVALCPAHDDHHPSFSMREGWPTGHCFACGHTRSWWTHVSARVGNGRAVLEELARLAGVQPLHRLSPEAEAAERRRRECEELREGFAADAITALGQPDGADVLSYLMARGYREDECRQAGLGAWPGGDRDQERLKLLGLDYDVAGRSHRLVICLRDPAGRLVGFALRAIGDPPRGTGKYLYSRGLDRSALLPGLHLARRQAGPLVLVEGLIDAAILAVRGLSVAAIGGSRLSTGQVAALRRAGVSSVVLSLDEDAAGRDGTGEAAITLLRAGFAVGIAPALPDGIKDPDELVQRDGLAIYRSLVAKHIPGVRWLVSRVLSATTTPVERDATAERLLEIAPTLPPMAEAEMVTAVGDALSVDTVCLREAVRRAVQNRAQDAVRTVCAEAADTLTKISRGEADDAETVLQRARMAVRAARGGAVADVMAAKRSLARRIPLPHIPWWQGDTPDSPVVCVTSRDVGRVLVANVLCAWLATGKPVWCLSEEPMEIIVARCVAVLASVHSHAAGGSGYSLRDVVEAERGGHADMPLLAAWDQTAQFPLRFGLPSGDGALVSDTWSEDLWRHPGPVFAVSECLSTDSGALVAAAEGGDLCCRWRRDEWQLRVHGGAVFSSGKAVSA